MVTCVIKDNRHLAKPTDIAGMEVTNAVFSGKSFQNSHELFAVDLIGSDEPFFPNAVGVKHTVFSRIADFSAPHFLDDVLQLAALMAFQP